MTVPGSPFASALRARFANCHEATNGEVWVRQEDALEAVEIAHELGLRVLGLEGFIVGGANVFPAMSRVADFSHRDLEWAADAARALLGGEWSTPPVDVDPSAAGDYLIEVVVTS